MKKTLLWLGVAALGAAGVVGAEENCKGKEIPAGPLRQLQRLQRWGIQLTDEQRQQLQEQWMARRGAPDALPEPGAWPPGRGRGGFGRGRAPGFAGFRGAGGQARPLRAEFMRLYDGDDDGKLSEEERAALRNDLKERRERLLKKYDQDGDGTLNEAERAKLRDDLLQFRKEAVAKYDADGDGKLSPEERAKAIRELWTSGAFLER